MDKKTTILLDTAGFLAAVHNYKKSEIADLIVALCEFNLYGCTSVKLTDMKKIHFDSIQEVIELRNSHWLKTCEINMQNTKKRTANRKATAERNSSEPPAPVQSDRPEDKENDSELDEDKESESDFINKKDKDKERENVDKSRYIGAPSVEEVAIYCKESGYTRPDRICEMEFRARLNEWQEVHCAGLAEGCPKMVLQRKRFVLL